MCMIIQYSIRVSTHQILTPNSVPFGSNSEGWGQIPKVKFWTFFKFRGKVQNLNSEPLDQILEVFRGRGGRAPTASSRRSKFGVKICFMCPRIKFWPQNLTSKSDPEGTKFGVGIWNAWTLYSTDRGEICTRYDSFERHLSHHFLEGQRSEPKIKIATITMRS